MGALFSKPKAPAPLPEAPKINQEILDRSSADAMRRRAGSAANILTGGVTGGGGLSGSVAVKKLLGQ
ncbi:MAG: hypothetical protein K0Q92_625 [Steroidobacteraceae bacterium]|jgi:hypothetical protein|nr:hypothetical protein [Steroidobacteraceae bacterium]